MHNVYLFQPQYTVEVRKEKNYWLPYSAGCIWSYAVQYQDISDNFQLQEIIFRREPHDEILARLIDPAVCGFSCYSWNYRYCLVLAEKIKTQWPDCRIVFGGAQSHGSLLANEFIDSLVFAEGEMAFVDVLRKYMSGEDPEIIYPKSRLQDLDIPSPYLIGLFDDLIKQHPDALWAATLETNRGCPYACTFCDWGGITYSKVKKFNLDRVAAELDWMAANNVAYIMTADANFGMFKDRDLQIAKLIRAAADRPTAKIESMNVNFAKNSSEVVFELGRVLGSLLRGGITFSLQSMNQQTLEDIHRTNMEINKISSMLKLGEKYGILTYSEMIIGLPNETEETWKHGITELLEMGQHQNIDIWFAQLLLNSELAQDDSRRKYQITSVMARDYITLGNSDEADDCVEYIEIINGTNTMTTSELVDAYLYSWMVVHFHITGYSQIIARYCRSIRQVSYRKFYDRLFEKIKKDPVLGAHCDLVRHTVNRYLTTGILINNEDFKGHTLHGMSYKFMYDNKNAAMTLAAEVGRELGPISSNVEMLQDNFIFDQTHNFPRQITSDINLETWVLEPTLYSIQNKASEDTFDFYFHRRKNLIKNRFVKIGNGSR